MLPLRHNREFMLLWSGQALSTPGSQASSLSVGYRFMPAAALAALLSPGIRQAPARETVLGMRTFEAEARPEAGAAAV